MRIPVRLFAKRGDYELFVGPWAARFIWNLKPTSGFGWIDGQGRVIAFIRRFWSGWHRWDVFD